MSDTQERFLLGITGKMGSGKTNVAEILTQRANFKIVRISEKLKEITKDLDLPYTRDVLQGIGDFFREIDENVWIRICVQTSQQIVENEHKSVVVDDVRYKNEEKVLRLNDFHIIRVSAAENLRKSRIQKRDNIIIQDSEWERWSSHATETQIEGINVDFEIDNNGSTEDLEKAILNIINEIKDKN